LGKERQGLHRDSEDGHRYSLRDDGVSFVLRMGEGNERIVSSVGQ
jgi:hypothetical protein